MRKLMDYKKSFVLLIVGMFFFLLGRATNIVLLGGIGGFSILLSVYLAFKEWNEQTPTGMFT